MYIVNVERMLNEIYFLEKQMTGEAGTSADLGEEFALPVKSTIVEIDLT